MFIYDNDRYSYFIVVAVITFNVTFMVWQQRGLSYFPSVYVIPINQVTLIIMGTILGGVYFDEFVGMSQLYAAMFIVSLLLTSMGVILLAAGNKMFNRDDANLKESCLIQSTNSSIQNSIEKTKHDYT